MSLRSEFSVRSYFCDKCWSKLERIIGFYDTISAKANIHIYTYGFDLDWIWILSLFENVDFDWILSPFSWQELMGNFWIGFWIFSDLCLQITSYTNVLYTVFH